MGNAESAQRNSFSFYSPPYLIISPKPDQDGIRFNSGSILRTYASCSCFIIANLQDFCPKKEYLFT